MIGHHGHIGTRDGPLEPNGSMGPTEHVRRAGRYWRNGVTNP
jgi:hypothetical protein